MEQSGDARSLQFTAGLYLLLFLSKLAVYWYTGIMAMLAEAVHTLTDVVVSAFLLVSIIWSRREADEIHMFGYGRAQNVAALISAALFISVSGLRLYEESIPRLLGRPAPAPRNLRLAIWILIVSMVAAAAPLLDLLRKRKRGVAAQAQVVALINDELGLVAALAGALLAARGYWWADPVASIAIATILSINAVALFRSNISLLIGRSPGPEFLSNIARLAALAPGVLGVHEIRAEYIGPGEVHTGMHIEVAKGLPIEEADQISREVRALLHREVGCRYCVIHVDAAKSGET